MSIHDLDGNQILRRNSEESQELYSLEYFISQMERISQISILFYCPHSKDTLTQFYYKMCEQLRLPQINLRSIRGFIQALKNQNRKIIKNQLQHYQQQMSKKMADNLLTLSKREFQKLLEKSMVKFFNDKLDYHIITEILVEKSKKSNFFSCVKILDMLREISIQIDDYVQPTLSPEKLILDRKISIKPEAQESQQFFDQVAMALINDPRVKLQNYFVIWHKKIALFTEFITDLQIRDQADLLRQSLKKQQSDLLQNLRWIYSQNEEGQAKRLRLQQEVERLQQEIKLYDQVNFSLKNQIYELKDKVTEVSKQKRECQQMTFQMERQIELGTVQLVKLQNYHVQIAEQLKSQRQRYTQLYNQYEKVTKKFNVESQIVKKEKVFQEMVLKDKLDDTLHKFKKLLTEKNDEKKECVQKQETYLTKIHYLQGRVEELEKQMFKKREDLRDFRMSSKIMNQKSFFMNRSFIDDKNESIIFQVRGSSLMNSGIKSKIRPEVASNQANSQTRISERLIEAHKNKPTNISKIKMINIGVQDLPQIQQENSHTVEISLLNKEQQSPKVQQSDKSQLPLEDKKKVLQNQKVEKIESIVPRKLDEINEAQNFMAKGVYITPHGVKYEVNILLSHKRFCYYDTKHTLVRYIPFQNIRSFVFCRQNCNLVILRPRNTEQLDRKKHITNPMIFIIRKRQRLVNYLTTKLNSLVKEHKIELLTKWQADISLKIDGQQISMKNNISTVTNLYRLALSNQPVFYVKLQESSLLTFKGNTIIVIQPIGLVCFKGDQINELQSKQQLLYILPLNDSIIAQRQNSIEAPGRKLSITYKNQSQRVFSLIFHDKQELRLFQRLCEQRKISNQKNKTNIWRNLDSQFNK